MKLVLIVKLMLLITLVLQGMQFDVATACYRRGKCKGQAALPSKMFGVLACCTVNRFKTVSDFKYVLHIDKIPMLDIVSD